ncbi:DUF6308 family protein [Kibdelosporangium aridum]
MRPSGCTSLLTRRPRNCGSCSAHVRARITGVTANKLLARKRPHLLPI